MSTEAGQAQLTHAVFKAGLFLGIGAIDHAAGTRKLSELGGLASRAPWLCAAVCLLAGSMAGLPPFAGFLSKELVLQKLMLADTSLHDIAVLGIVVGSIGTVAYTARFLLGCFAGSPRSDGAAAAHRVGVSFLLPPALLAGLSLTGGLGARLVDTRILEPMTAALLGAPLEAPQLRLWRGINTPLILSGVIVSLGFVLYRLSERRQVPGAPRWLSGDRVFERFLSGAQAVGAVCNRALAGASPSVYFALLLGSGFVFALPLTRHLGGLFNSTWDGVGVVILSILACALVLLLRLPSRLGRILAFTVVGFAVTVLYSLLNAPDLVLTQVLVEVLTTIVFVLAVRLAAHRTSGPSPARALQAVRLAFAMFVGVACAALVFAVQALPKDARLSSYYFEVGPAQAEENNLVNLVLADFRGFDTLVETLVVLLAALGAIALMVGREIPLHKRQFAIPIPWQSNPVVIWRHVMAA